MSKGRRGRKRLQSQPEQVNTATLVKKPARPELSIEEQENRRAFNGGLWALLCLFLLPALAPIAGGAAIYRNLQILRENGGALRTACGVLLGAMAVMCGLGFWLMWGLFRPTPLVLAAGWPGLRRLPAVDVGFRPSRKDPFGFGTQDFHLPGRRT